jgi:hypothetical protein
MPRPLVTVIAMPVRDTGAGAGAGARRGAVAGAAGAGAGGVWVGRGAAGAGVCPNDVPHIKSDKLNQNSVRMYAFYASARSGDHCLRRHHAPAASAPIITTLPTTCAATPSK